MTVPRGTIVFATLDPTMGHEQAGRRPCVVLTDPAMVSGLRFPLLAVVPLTSTQFGASRYPVVRPVPGSGLLRPSTALYDNVRSIDPSRLIRAAGPIDPQNLEAIEQALARFLGLS